MSGTIHLGSFNVLSYASFIARSGSTYWKELKQKISRIFNLALEKLIELLTFFRQVDKDLEKKIVEIRRRSSRRLKIQEIEKIKGIPPSSLGSSKTAPQNVTPNVVDSRFTFSLDEDESTLKKDREAAIFANSLDIIDRIEGPKIEKVFDEVIYKLRDHILRDKIGNEIVKIHAEDIKLVRFILLENDDLRTRPDLEIITKAAHNYWGLNLDSSDLKISKEKRINLFEKVILDDRRERYLKIYPDQADLVNQHQKTILEEQDLSKADNLANLKKTALKVWGLDLDHPKLLKSQSARRAILSETVLNILEKSYLDKVKLKYSIDLLKNRDADLNLNEALNFSDLITLQDLEVLTREEPQDFSEDIKKRLTDVYLQNSGISPEAFQAFSPAERRNLILLNRDKNKLKAGAMLAFDKLADKIHEFISNITDQINANSSNSLLTGLLNVGSLYFLKQQIARFFSITIEQKSKSIVEELVEVSIKNLHKGLIKEISYSKLDLIAEALINPNEDGWKSWRDKSLATYLEVTKQNLIDQINVLELEEFLSQDLEDNFKKDLSDIIKGKSKKETLTILRLYLSTPSSNFNPFYSELINKLSSESLNFNPILKKTISLFSGSIAKKTVNALAPYRSYMLFYLKLAANFSKNLPDNDLKELQFVHPKPTTIHLTFPGNFTGEQDAFANQQKHRLENQEFTLVSEISKLEISLKFEIFDSNWKKNNENKSIQELIETFGIVDFRIVPEMSLMTFGECFLQKRLQEMAKVILAIGKFQLNIQNDSSIKGKIFDLLTGGVKEITSLTSRIVNKISCISSSDLYVTTRFLIIELENFLTETG